MSSGLEGTAAGPAPADTIVTGRVVTMDAARRIIADGAVAAAGGRIVAVGDRADILARFRASRLIDGRDQIVLPGMTDCHTHSTQSLVRGLIGSELPMIYRLYIPADMSLTPEEAYQGARLCAVQLALSGVTTMCDFAGDTTPEHEDAIIQGAADVGLRLVFLRGKGDQDFHHAALYTQIRERSWARMREGQAERDLMRTEALLSRAKRDDTGLFHAGVCPSSLLGYSDAYVRMAIEMAARHGCTLQVHAARDREEVEFCLGAFGRRPIERLADLGAIASNLVCVHAILATPHEIRLLGEGRAGVAHSAVEVVNILNGIPALARLREAGITVGLGCDNAVNDMFVVMHTAWALQTGIHGIAGYDAEAATEDDVFAMATTDAARLMGLGDHCGSLEVGKAADLVVLDGNGPHMMPLQAVPTDLVRFAGRSNVRHVLCAGRPIVTDGAIATVDSDELSRAVRPIGSKLSDVVTARRYRLLRGCC